VIQLIILGSIYFIDNLYLFIFFSYIAQTLGGIGAGLNSTCAMAIITSCFPDDREDNIAILEAGVGIGMLLGPLLGALLYTLGGYVFPFYFVAVIILALYPIL
jgi:MFS family permease